jgi:shikimate kinase
LAITQGRGVRKVPTRLKKKNNNKKKVEVLEIKKKRNQFYNTCEAIDMDNHKKKTKTKKQKPKISTEEQKHNLLFKS